MIDPTAADAMLQEELGYAVRDNNPFAPTNIEAYPQVAGLIPRGLLSKATKDIVSNFYEKQGSKSTAPTPEELRQSLEATGVMDEVEPSAADVLAQEAPPVEGEMPPVEGEMPPVEGEMPPQPGGPLEMPEEGVTDDVLQAYTEGEAPDPLTEKRTDQRNINIQRHHQGGIANPELADMPPEVALENMKTADDIALLLDVVADTQPAQPARSNASLEAATQDMSQVKQILSERFGADPKQMGLMNDKQLLASRKMLSTLGEKVVELANKIKEGDQNPKTLLEYQRMAEGFVALQRYTQGQVKEVARALQQQNMIAGSLNANSVESIMDMLNTSARTPEAIAMQAKNVATTMENDPENGLAKAFKPTWRDYTKTVTEFWTNNILSGVSTQVVNTVGNASVQAWEDLILRPLAAGIGETRKALGVGATDDYVSGKEALVNVWSGYAGTRDGVRALYETLKTGQSQFGPEKGEEIRGSMEQVLGYHGQEMGGEKGRAIGEGIATASTLTFRMLQAQDDLFKTLGFRKELTALAVRDGLREGKSGEALDQHVKGIMDDPSEDIFEAAMAKSREVTFTENEFKGVLGSMVRGVKTLVNEQPYLKFIMPFINTPANLVDYGMKSSALATMSPALWRDIKAGGAKADIASAKMVAGVGLTLAVYQAYEAGNITGDGPEDWKLRKVLEKQGWQPNSIRIGDKYYSYKRGDPFAMGIASLANQLDKAKYARTQEGFEQYFLQGAFGIAKHTLDATFMKGANELLNVIDDPSKVNSWASNYATGFIPYAGVVRTGAKLIDPQPRRISDDKNFETGMGTQLSQRVKSAIPFASEELRPARYWDGSLITPEGGRVVYAMSPYKTSTLNPDPASKALVENGVGPAEPTPMMRVAGVEFSLLSLDNGKGAIYDRYVEEVGKARLKAVNEVIGNKSFQKADSGPDSTKASVLKSAISKATTAAKMVFLKETLITIAEEDENAATTLATIIGSDFVSFLKNTRKDINTLPPEERENVRVKGENIGKLPNPEPRF